MTKYCQNCGRLLLIGDNELKSRFNKRKYCNKACFHESRIGIKLSEQTKKKISIAHQGKKVSDEFKELMRKRMTGKNNPMKKESIRLKLGRILKGKKAWNKGLRGEGTSNWQGGLSFEKYPADWTQTLKRSIRERDNYACQICGKEQGDKAFCVHHIDYVKKNCDPNNLITLCRSCHTKTNNHRDEWINYFKEQIK